MTFDSGNRQTEPIRGSSFLLRREPELPARLLTQLL
jgi:hypothetical protein